MLNHFKKERRKKSSFVYFTNGFYVSSSNEARSKRRKAECHRSRMCIDRLTFHYKIGYFKSPQSGIQDTPFGSGLQVVSVHYFNLCVTPSCFTRSCFVQTRYVEAIFSILKFINDDRKCYTLQRMLTFFYLSLMQVLFDTDWLLTLLASPGFHEYFCWQIFRFVTNEEFRVFELIKITIVKLLINIFRL